MPRPDDHDFVFRHAKHTPSKIVSDAKIALDPMIDQGRITPLCHLVSARLSGPSAGY
jgi:hypothetical protein